MESLLVYSFKTFPYINELQNNFNKIFILKSLKKDLNSFCHIIKNKNPEVILGIASSNNTKSYFEPITINKFNKNGTVLKEGIYSHQLYIPNLTNSDFLISKHTSTSFCNYSMYYIKNFLVKNNIDTKFCFTHINKNNISTLTKIFNIK